MCGFLVREPHRRPTTQSGPALLPQPRCHPRWTGACTVIPVWYTIISIRIICKGVIKVTGGMVAPRGGQLSCADLLGLLRS